MKIYFFVLTAIVWFSSCSTVYQVQFAKVSSVEVQKHGDTLVYENDTLRVTYNLWSNRGRFEFSVYNKLDVPIYIDWKRSSFILNSTKMDYWIDNSTTDAAAYYGSYSYSNTYSKGAKASETAGVGVSHSVSVKSERITFLPPHSKTIVPMGLCILPTTNFDMSKAQTIAPNVLQSEITPEAAKFHMNNFMTYSLKEDMSNERYVSNSFYISRVSQVNIKVRDNEPNTDKNETSDDVFWRKVASSVGPDGFWLCQ